MTQGVSGLHHVTAIASDPQRNLDFYIRVLGLRLVNDGRKGYHRPRGVLRQLFRLLPVDPEGTTVLSNTELRDAGFSGTVNLTAVSSNARLLSQSTSYDPGSDTITTVGDYDLLAPGVVFGTYTITGTFTNLFDIDGLPIIGTQTFVDASDPIAKLSLLPRHQPCIYSLAACWGFS